ncbi:phage tail-collar fiber domain-containing protein [Shewanella scandinavica]|uniref:phage tail-collar fiber domain-containing protein n=1 Tax=Shewanella scandinavica TaxID=3063538 RepID=UPI00319402F6
MAQVITIAGERLFALKAQNNQQLDIDTFIFAFVPGQDSSAPIDRNEGLPPIGQRVHTQIVQQTGLINENAVVYSSVLDSLTGPFDFNWVGLYSSVNQTLIAIIHTPTVSKTVTVPGAAGNILNRNFVIEYSGIAELTGITVDPTTWQYDFEARLNGMDELTRQLAADMNGKDWFIDDGFKVVPRSTLNTFKVTAGAGYVSGLRVELAADHILNLSSYPQFVYVDAWFDGTSESVWKGHTAFTVTNTEMDDYIDVNGRNHYVFKLARITAADTVEDLRGETNFASRTWSNSKFVTKSDAENKYQHKKNTLDCFMTCTDANDLAFTGGMFHPDDLNKSPAISSGDVNSGVLVNANYGASFDFILPYAVIIGDSIAEGHPGRHGRLHPNSDGFDPDYKSLPGQLSYELAKKLNIPFINQGIGSQTTVDIRNRWDRDVLHQIIDVGDGRGSNTMNFGGQLPYLVYLHVGVNDVNLFVPIDTIKDNFIFFAQSCKENNILLIVDNIGSYSGYGVEQELAAKTINKWLSEEFVSQFSNVELIDYLEWSSDETYDYRHLREGMFADYIHPNFKGYEALSNFIIKNIKAPVFFDSIVADSTIDGPTRFNRVKRFTFNNEEFLMGPDPVMNFKFNINGNVDSPLSKMVALDFDVITSDGGIPYTGFCKVYGKFSNESKISALVNVSDNKSIIATGVIIQGELNGSWKSFGIKNIDKSDLVNGNIKLNLDKPAQLLVVNMVGSLNESHEYQPRWVSEPVGIEGKKDWTINLRKSSDGQLAASELLHNYQIMAYMFY